MQQGEKRMKQIKMQLKQIKNPLTTTEDTAPDKFR